MNRQPRLLGAAGRDFHNFNTFFRDNDQYYVVAFTANQIPNIEGRIYPAELAGSLYPQGIPIHPEEDLPILIRDKDINECIFSYSDVSYQKVMELSALVNAAGATFTLMGPDDTMVKSTKPLISVGAVRTGCGKSQTSRKIVSILNEMGLKVVAIRHPMPYGDLAVQKVQRFAELEDFQKHQCTIEEMEEYEPYVVRGNVIYAGIDYEAILRQAEQDPNGCDVIIWDGGNNDFPFYKSDLHFTVVDPHRPGHELSYYPGEVTLRLADVVVINKMDSAPAEGIRQVKENIARVVPQARVIEAESSIRVDDSSMIKGKKVLVVEDGPTLTHGEMKLGAGTIAAQKFGATEMVDPRPYTVGKLTETFDNYPEIGLLLPAMGYGDEQLQDLESTINHTDCDSVIVGTPIDLSRVINMSKPSTRVYYDLHETGDITLETVLREFIKQHNLD